MKKMKKSVITAGLTLAVLLMGFTSCEKSDDPASIEIEGEYIGSFSISSSLKSTPAGNLDEDPGTAVVSMMGDMQIEVHCFGEEIDTIFMLDYYNHNDSVMVCLTGDDFTNMYGHMLGEGNMNHNGMDWMQHLNDEHQEGDEHFGFFDMQHHTFEFTFQMSEGDFHFQGTKNLTFN